MYGVRLTKINELVFVMIGGTVMIFLLLAATSSNMIFLLGIPLFYHIKKEYDKDRKEGQTPGPEPTRTKLISARINKRTFFDRENILEKF